MPSAQPTCAARVIRSKFVQNGWGATLTKETNDMVSMAKQDAEGMYQLQLSRDRPISARSLRSAIFWEHRHLNSQKIVSTPAVDDELELELFSDPSDQKQWVEGLDKIRKSITESSESIQMHPMFGPMRDREFTLWSFRIDEVWVTIFFRVEPKQMELRSCDNYFDREVSQLAIADPWPKDREARRNLIKTRLPYILGEGCIELKTSVIQSFPLEDTKDEWATGHLAYAVSREIFRRLKVLMYRQRCQMLHRNGDIATNFLWDKFEEDHDVDGYRQALMAACAHQTIEKSSFHVRLALEVPSEKSKHQPCALNHTLLGREHVPDEMYTKSHYTVRNVVVEIPEDKRLEENDEAATQEDSEESDVDEMDAEYEAEEASSVDFLTEETEARDSQAPTTPNDSLEMAEDTPSNEFANDDSDPQVPSEQEAANGEFSVTDGNSLKRPRSIDEEDLDEDAKRQKLEEETPNSPVQSVPLTPAQEQKDVPEFMFINPQGYRPASPDTNKRPLSDREDSPAKRIKEEDDDE
ncbi:hypothetical protein F5Y06DRAFT_286474 [Hypoxylon sp. FL0890]|nr:hypothetical protein F5Y06DRAFT_286474 [Hypoxylon sp. FL0890]